jgi:hypothetical protein
MSALSDRENICELANRFANSFDLKDWTALEECLSDNLLTDYSDLRGTPPEVISKRRFVELRRTALDAMATHHLTGNHEIVVDGDAASATVSCAIFRKNAGGERLDTHCIYFFKVERNAGIWKISAIKQKLLLNDGDTSIHAGIVRK